MVKFLLNSLVIFLMLASFAFAKNDDAKIKKEFGPDLTQAPFFIRYSFSKQYDKDWGESTYSEREAFLTKYEANLTAEQKQEKADAKALAEEKKERLQEKKRIQRKLADRIKAEIDEEKANKKEDKDRQRDFDKMIKDQQRDLQQMEREASQDNH